MTQIFGQTFWKICIKSRISFHKLTKVLSEQRDSLASATAAQQHGNAEKEVLIQHLQSLNSANEKLKTENGYWLPTDAPGLGIEVNETAAAKHPFQQEVIHALNIRAHDNAILDW